MDLSPRPATTTTSSALPTALLCTSSVLHHRRRNHPPRLATPTRIGMSFRLGRVVSDLSHRKAKDHGDGVRHQSTSNNEHSSNAGAKAKQRILLLFTGVSAWRRSDVTGDTGRATKGKKRHQTEENSKRRGLDIGHAVWKYLSMVEQLFTSSSGGGRNRRDMPEPRRRPPTFIVSSRGSSGNNKAPSRRHKGRLSSAPASLRGSPANSGHLSVGESVKMSTSSSELSTMEELQSAIQAAIAHCKSSVAVGARQAPAAGGDRCKC